MKAVLWITAALVYGLGVLHFVLATRYGFPPKDGLMRVINLDQEAVLPAWYSSALFLAAALGLLLAGVLDDAARRTRRFWFALAAVMAFLSLDESASLHESSGQIVEWLSVPDGGLEFPWVIFGAFAAAALGLLFLPMLLRIDRRTAWDFSIAGGVYLTGVILMEVVGGVVAAHEGRSDAYSLTVVIEEGFEFAGLTLFVTAVLRHLARNHPIVDLRLGGKHGGRRNAVEERCRGPLRDHR